MFMPHANSNDPGRSVGSSTVVVADGARNLLTPSSGNTTAPITSWPRTGAGTGASAVGIVACCAHHLADLLPLLGAAGVTGFLFDWRILLMIAGLGINLVAVTVAVRRLSVLTHDTTGSVSCAA